MQLTFPESLREALRARLTQRGAAALLALSVELLIVLLFLTISSSFILKNHAKKPNLFRVEEKKKEEKKAAPPIEIAKEDSKRRNGGGSKPAASPVQAAPALAPTPDTAKPANILWLSRNDYRASDIAGRQGTAVGPGQGNGKSAESDSALADGKGPHGEKVYVAEWYREPTHAELDPYVPERVRGRSGWGMVICRTVPNYRVEDCQEVGDSPRGSGYAGAVRQAAFQFRIRPTRIGGKPQIGTWVYVRVQYIVTMVHGDSARPGPQSDDDTSADPKPDNQ
jgi:hypothetical protein